MFFVTYMRNTGGHHPVLPRLPERPCRRAVRRCWTEQTENPSRLGTGLLRKEYLL
jgi:hypothetical protein